MGIDIKTLPILGAFVEKMDEGLIIRNESGEVVFTNPTGACILAGRKKVLSQHQTKILIGDEKYTQCIYVVDYSHLCNKGEPTVAN